MWNFSLAVEADYEGKSHPDPALAKHSKVVLLWPEALPGATVGLLGSPADPDLLLSGGVGTSR